MDRPRGLAALDAARDRARSRASCSAARRRVRAAARAAAVRRRAVAPRGEPAGSTVARRRRSAGRRWRALRVRARARRAAAARSGAAAASSPVATASWSPTRCSTSTGLRQAGEHGLIGNRHDLAPGAARVPASRAAALGRACTRLGVGPARRLPDLEAGRVVVLFARAPCVRAPLPAPRAATAGSRWCWRCSSARRSPRWSAGAGSATPATSSQFDFITGRAVDAAPTSGATCSRRSPSGCCRSALLAYERSAALGARGGGRAAVRVAAAVAGRDVRDRARRRGASCAAARVALARCARSRAARGHRRAARLLPRCSRCSTRRGSWPARVNDLPRWPWWVLVVGLGAARRARARSRTGCPAPDFGAVALRRLAARRAARLLPAVRDVPVPRPAGPDAAARGARGARAAGAPRERAGRGSAAVGVVACWCVLGTAYRVDELADAVHVGRQPFFLTRRGARRAALPRPRAPSPAACSRPSTRGIARARLHGARDLDRRRLVDAATSPSRDARRPRRCSAGGSTPAAGGGARAAVRRALPALATATAGRTSPGVVARLHGAAAALRLRDRLEGAVIAGRRGALRRVDALRAIAALSDRGLPPGVRARRLRARAARALARAAQRRRAAVLRDLRLPALPAVGAGAAGRRPGRRRAGLRACGARCGSCPRTGSR